MTSPTPFRLAAPYAPAGDQPAAIATLTEGLRNGDRHQVLLGATGTGKTFTIANVINAMGWPTLVLAPNKTLAAQLYGELKAFFPENAVEYFVSYYDYYQPEAYVPSTNTYIEKDAIVNDAIDRMRHAATVAMLTRTDVIIVASVSCIYGIGSREAYDGMHVGLEVGDTLDRDELLRRLVEIQYERNDYDLHRGAFRVRGDVVEVFPAGKEDVAYRVSFFGDEVDEIAEIDPLRGRVLTRHDRVAIFPASHYVSFEEDRKRAITLIREELGHRLRDLRAEEKLLEAQRLEERTLYDLEMLEQMGHCNGVENYSRHLAGRGEGDPPTTLVDYFPRPFLMIVDESHVAIPQVGAMYRGDRSRKEQLVNYGFRLPSALDNRPLKFGEWLERVNHCVYVSATPANWELEQAGGVVVEQVVRPTGLLDPVVSVRPVGHQVDDLLGEIKTRIDRNERVLVTTLTKRMSEDLCEYYGDLGIKVRYLHSDIDTLERMAIIKDLRKGVFDVLVGINLLREGLDLPEVSLVAILDADKEGFLRGRTSLIQTIGRAARNVNGQVLLYADRMTDSMIAAMDETDRRRSRQAAYNTLHGITPKTISKPILELHAPDEGKGKKRGSKRDAPPKSGLNEAEVTRNIERLKKEMWQAAKDERFEEAAQLRDTLKQWEALQLAG